MDFDIPVDHRVKIRKYLDLARELKKTAVEHEGERNANCSWCVGTVSKNLKKRQKELEITGIIETIQTIALLRLARILRRVLET